MTGTQSKNLTPYLGPRKTTLHKCNELINYGLLDFWEGPFGPIEMVVNLYKYRLAEFHAAIFYDKVEGKGQLFMTIRVLGHDIMGISALTQILRHEIDLFRQFNYLL